MMINRLIDILKSHFEYTLWYFLINRLSASKKQIAIIWSCEDVLSVRPDLTTKQAFEVLKFAKSNHDATVGVNWETVKIAAEILFPRAKAS